MTSRLQPEITFFLDNCLGRYVVSDALRNEGYEVELHTDHFAEDAPDTEWLPEVGKRGWIILTKDNHIHRNQIEIAALLKSATASFVLRAKKATGAQMAEAYVKALPSIHRFLQKFDKPFVATVTPAGSVSILYPLSKLVKHIK